MFRHGIFLPIICVALLASPMPSPKTQCEGLLDAVLPMATKTLKEHGEFYPFGASLKQDGKVALAMAYGGREKPPSQPLIDILRDGFRADASTRKIIASAVVYDVRVIPPGTSEKMATGRPPAPTASPSRSPEFPARVSRRPDSGTRCAFTGQKVYPTIISFTTDRRARCRGTFQG
jgi:hypothetical protein